MMTIKQYAKMQNVSYEAIRKQVERYRADLDGHIIKDNKVQMLDDYAIDFLNQRRRESPVIIYEKERTEIEEQLRAELDSTKSLLIQAQSEIIKLNDTRLQLVEATVRVQYLTEQNEKISSELKGAAAAAAALDVIKAEKEKELEAIREQIRQLTEDRDNAVREASSYTKTWFGLYKKL